MSKGIIAVCCLFLMTVILGCAKVRIDMSQAAVQGAAGQDSITDPFNHDRCPPCPPVRETSFSCTFFYEDADLGPWMWINNSFISETDPPEDEEIWQGILFQLGAWTEPEDPDKEMNVFDFIDIDGTRYERPDGPDAQIPFEWINIVPTNDSRPDPLPDADLYRYLYANGNDNHRCHDFDECVAGTECRNIQGANGYPVVENCLRLRSLHGFFIPEAVITYWVGKNGYELLVGGGNVAHPTQTFLFKDPVNVYVKVRNGDTVPHLDVRSISIIHRVDELHTNHHDPPMGGW